MSAQIDLHQTFRRSQMEHALWQFVSSDMAVQPDISHLFIVRLKKLLDTDRMTAPDKNASFKYAFRDNDGSGQGNDAEYTTLEVIRIWVAVELLNAGFKQAEIIYIIRYIRTSIDKAAADIMRHPYIGRDTARPKDYPGMPVYVDKDGHKSADPYVYMLLNKIELKELYPKSKKGPASLILQPKIVNGVEAYKHHLFERAFSQHSFVTIELSEATHCLLSNLKAAPIVKRGRK